MTVAEVHCFTASSAFLVHVPFLALQVKIPQAMLLGTPHGI